ncbi:hypothetical protein ALQ61_05565, partial [Pseudomonas coronafaciens pv. zizaniae]
VRYDVKPQDNPTFVAAHFRANPHHDHHPDCEWVDESADEKPDIPVEETDVQTRLRQAKRKLDDYIDIFDPTLKAPAKEKSGEEKAGAGNPQPPVSQPLT